MPNLESIAAEFSKDDLIYFFLPIFVLSMVLEYTISRQRHLELYQADDTKASLWMLLLTGLTDLVPKFLAFIAFFYLAGFSPLADVVQRQWWAWLVLFVLDDFIYYWFHRLNHQVRFFWAGHISHHSAIKMNFATALRQGVGERLHKYFYWLPCPCWVLTH